MRKLFLLIVFLLVSLFAQEQKMIDWDLKSEVILENDGNGGGVRVRVPIKDLEYKKTFDFEILSGEFKSFKIFVKAYNKQQEREFIMLLSERYDSLAAYSKSSIKSLNTYKKEDEWTRRDDFIFVVNGDDDRFDDKAVKVKMIYRPFTSYEKDTRSSTAALILMVLFGGSVGLLYFKSNKKYDEMLFDRNVKNSSIISFVFFVGFGFFIIPLVVTYLGSFIVGTLFNATKGFNNEIGFMMVVAVVAGIAYAFKMYNTVKYHRCPNCNKFGDVQDMGTDFEGSSTTTTYQGNKVVGKSTTSNYTDYRKCSECEHTWGVKRTATSSWGTNK